MIAWDYYCLGNTAGNLAFKAFSLQHVFHGHQAADRNGLVDGHDSPFMRTDTQEGVATELPEERLVMTSQVDQDRVVKRNMTLLPPVRMLIHLGKVLLHEFSKRDIDSHGFGEDFSILLDEDDVGIVFHCFP